VLYARGLTVRSTSYHYIAASRDLSNKDSIKTGLFSGCGALKLSNTSVGCRIQQSPASCLGGRSMQQSPVSCLGGCSRTPNALQAAHCVQQKRGQRPLPAVHWGSAVTTTAAVGRRIRKRDTSAAGCVIVSGPVAVAEALAVTGLVGAPDFPVISTTAAAATVAATAAAAVVSAAAIAATATSAVASAATSAVASAATSVVVTTATAAVTATSTPTTISTSTKTKATHIFDLLLFYLVVLYHMGQGDKVCIACLRRKFAKFRNRTSSFPHSALPRS